MGRLVAGARASRSGGDSVLDGREEKDSPKEELHDGAGGAVTQKIIRKRL
jgi:hypothetical protein